MDWGLGIGDWDIGDWGLRNLGIGSWQLVVDMKGFVALALKAWSVYLACSDRRGALSQLATKTANDEA